MSSRVDVGRLLETQACIEAAARALRIGLVDAAAGELELAVTWYGRAESSLAFGNALAAYLRSRRCLTR